jgi:tellurite resistance protein TehA-like permease
MFRRILVENWQTALTIVSFAIFLATFIAVLIRTLRTPRNKIARLENLPLEDDHD